MSTKRGAATVLAFAFWAPLLLPASRAGAEGNEGGLSGRQLYERRCAMCHGLDGGGNGPVARYMDPPPRDFTAGSYKLRSTPSGELPTDADLLRTITRGIPGTAMPAWRGLALDERLALVSMVKSFSAAFDEDEPAEPLEIRNSVPMTLASIQKGGLVYERMKCGECHGPEGKGDGPSARKLKDDLGRPIYPFDFTRSWKMKGGATPEAIYRTFMTGLDGTPMPSYADVISEEEAWNLVNYCMSLFLDR